MKATQLFLVVLTAVFTFSCNKKITSKKDPVILTVDGKEILTSDFKYAYEKNRKKDEHLYSEESVKEYLDLFINFKLKVREAEKLELDKDPKFIKELDSYKKQLAKPYLSDDEFVNSLAEQAYERSKYDIKASHILIKTSSQDSPKDTLSKYNKIKNIRDSILNGKISFEQAASTYSEDPSAKHNKGDLGFFSALKMVYQFENEAYTTPEGEVSKIVKTKFGYHILKVEEKREALGNFTVNHILFRSKKTEQQNLELANTVYEKLKQGGDWKTLCKEYSDDDRSKYNEGRLRAFKTGELNESNFENAAFALKTPGEFSEPVQTRFGYHIIQLVQIEPIKPFEELKEDLINRIKKDSRSQLAQLQLSQKLEKENEFKQTELLSSEKVTSEIDSIVQAKWDWETKSKITNNVLFTIGDSSFTLKPFYEYLAKVRIKYRGRNAELVKKEAFEDYKMKKIIDYEMAQLPNKYPAYRRITNEYKDGILLFNLMNKNVWQKAMKDSIGLKKYYNSNKSKYLYNDRILTTTFT